MGPPPLNLSRVGGPTLGVPAGQARPCRPPWNEIQQRDSAKPRADQKPSGNRGKLKVPRRRPWSRRAEAGLCGAGAKRGHGHADVSQLLGDGDDFTLALCEPRRPLDRRDSLPDASSTAVTASASSRPARTSWMRAFVTRSGESAWRCGRDPPQVMDERPAANLCQVGGLETATPGRLRRQLGHSPG